MIVRSFGGSWVISKDCNLGKMELIRPDNEPKNTAEPFK